MKNTLGYAIYVGLMYSKVLSEREYLKISNRPFFLFNKHFLNLVGAQTHAKMMENGGM